MANDCYVFLTRQIRQGLERRRGIDCGAGAGLPGRRAAEARGVPGAGWHGRAGTSRARGRSRSAGGRARLSGAGRIPASRVRRGSGPAARARGDGRPRPGRRYRAVSGRDVRSR